MRPAETRPLRVVSGGQTGVDRGALDAALERGVPCGGWCPAGRLAEDGVIPARYPVTELRGAGYDERTRKNVEDSDGTLIVTFGRATGGTARTRGGRLAGNALREGGGCRTTQRCRPPGEWRAAGV